MYFDDRAVNPYLTPLTSMGIFGMPSPVALPSPPTANVHNEVRREGDAMVKTGPASRMAGEAAFYRAVAGLPVAGLFPRMLEYVELADGQARMRTIFEAGVLVFNLYRYGLIEAYHLERLVAGLDVLHASTDVPVTLDARAVRAQYYDKLVRRCVRCARPRATCARAAAGR